MPNFYRAIVRDDAGEDDPGQTGWAEEMEDYVGDEIEVCYEGTQDHGGGKGLFSDGTPAWFCGEYYWHYSWLDFLEPKPPFDGKAVPGTKFVHCMRCGGNVVEGAKCQNCGVEN